MKRTLRTLIALSLAVLVCFVFASCSEHEHVGEWTTVTEPTCTAEGKQTRTCTDCGETQTKEIPATGHIPGDAATCTTTQNCTVCNVVVIPALGHTAGDAATCTTAQICTVCNANVVPALGHTLGAVATCTTAQTCTVCEAEVAPALGHKEVTDAAVAPTCTATGKTEGKHCSVCNEVLVAQEEVAALGHTEAIDAAVAPTCTEAGKTEGKHCSVCNEVLVAQTEVAALGHTEVIDEAVAPTCTATGKTEGKHCSVCNEVLVAQTEVVALGHTAGDAATCTTAQICTVCEAELVAALGHTAGDAATCTTAQTCTVCNAELVAAFGHTEVTDAAVAPTCTATGKTEGKHCSTCNEIFTAQEEVAALGHTEAIDEAIAPTCTENGLTEGKHCSVCNELLVVPATLVALGHTEVIDEAVAPTYTETGLTEGKHCSVCNEILVVQEEVEVLVHTETTTVETTTVETTTAETTTVETTTVETTTTLYPVFGRFDFGTDTKAEELGMTSHEYLTRALTYDSKFISVEYTEDTIIVKALQDHPEMFFTGLNGAESIPYDEDYNPAYSITSYALCFEDLITYDFEDEMKKEKGIMRIRIKNETTNNIIAVRWHKANQSYATTLLASCMYLQGGEPNMIDWINGDNKMTCEPSATFETYDYNMNDLAALGRFGANKYINSQSYGLYEYYVYCGGATGSNNWNWMGNEAITAFQFFVLGAYGGSAASGRYYFTYADTRANIVEGATVEIDYIIFGKDTTELDKFQSNIESESISISESEEFAYYESYYASYY